MSNRRVNEYAYAHARVRGRIGDMPNELGWQQIVNAGDLETTIETMAGTGLQHWVTDFPRHPSPQEIERRCLISLLGICLFVNAHLSERWKHTGHWILQLPHVLQLRSVLSAKTDEKRLLPGSPFQSLMSQQPEHRLKILGESPYGIYLDEKRSPESCWAEQFESSLPSVNAQERHTMMRLGKLLTAHFNAIEPEMSSEQVWLQRNILFEHLKALLAGDPFHIGTLLIYGLLESIQFEKVRAVLLLRAYQWPTKLLGGLS